MIVHVDMDAFFASVEQRDCPDLRGKPVVVAWRGKRSVVCAASFEARRFGVHSAMAATLAERLCPEAAFVPPDFTRYRAVSQAVREIFLRHTDLIEPLSLDEAYLDVTVNKTGVATATKVASLIRQQIREELNLTASAGVAPNKFLAKIAKKKVAKLSCFAHLLESKKKCNYNSIKSIRSNAGCSPQY
jgi:DNA polymerase-4